jgi:hypothetical protein
MNALKALLLVVVPILLVGAAGKLMAKLSGRLATVHGPCFRCDPATPLNLRLLGYDRQAVAEHWALLDTPAETAAKRREAERKFLEIDLVFPFFYGGVFLAGLLLAWAWLGRPFAPGWLVAPVAVAAVADWIENLALLGQLRRWTGAGGGASGAVLDAGWIGVASAATIVKLWAVLATLALLLALAGWVGFRSPAGE